VDIARLNELMDKKRGSQADAETASCAGENIAVSSELSSVRRMCLKRQRADDDDIEVMMVRAMRFNRAP
jgi:hypothetical protein